MSTQVTVEALKEKLHQNLLEALYHLFPAGRVERKTFFIGNVKGDKGDSLQVELSGAKTGLWHDFATGEGGDVFSLWGATHGWDHRRDFPDILKSVQEWLGVSPVPLLQGNAPRTSPTQESEPLGAPTGKWYYRDVDGNPTVRVYRYDPPTGKEFRCWDIRARKWQAPYPRPLYNQPGMARSDTVILVEGEKCAEALINLGICATTAMNGANAPIDKTDWSPLKGKHVIVWPDHDAPGKGYADRAIQHLGRLGVASLSLMNIPEDKPEKWDAADAVVEGMEVRDFLDACPKTNISPVSEPETIPDSTEKALFMEPLPLRKKWEEAGSYPIEALGDLLGGAALDIHDEIQIPLAVCAQSVLANAALTVQGHIDIQLPFGQNSPTSLFLISISESGARKSVADKKASVFIKKREKELREKQRQELLSYANAKDAYESLRRKVLNDKSYHNQQELEIALNALGSPPIPPLDPLLTAPEPTYEGMCGYFMKGQPGIGLFSDEGGQFISGHGMNVDNKIKTAAGLSSLWGGEPIKRMRGGDGTVVLVGKRLSMHLMVQPGIVEKLLSDPELLQQGFLSRLLVVYPPHLFGTRLSTKKKVRDGSALENFNDQMLEIARKALPVNPESGKNELTPRVLEMTPEAQAAFYAFSDRIETHLRDGGDLESIRGFGSKLAEQASRIAAIMAFAEDPDILSLQRHHFDRGAILAEYYMREALRLFGSAYAPPDILEAESLLEWLKNIWPSKTSHSDLISLPHVYQFAPNKIRKKETAMNALKTLEDHGWLVKEKNGSVIDGEYRRDIWRIRREFFDVKKQETVTTLATLANFSNLERFPQNGSLLTSPPNFSNFSNFSSQLGLEKKLEKDDVPRVATLAINSNLENKLEIEEELEGVNI